MAGFGIGEQYRQPPRLSQAQQRRQAKQTAPIAPAYTEPEAELVEIVTE